MALPTFKPPCNPSPGSTESHEPAILKAAFGDGYTQAAPRGLNHDRAEVEIVFEILTKSERDSVVAFFEDRGGYQPFTYRMPWHASAMKWTVEKWSETIVSGSYHRIAATFRQSFDLRT